MDVDLKLNETLRSISTKRIATEKDFHDYLGQLRQSDVPDLFVIDMMLRWADPAPGLQAPPDDVQAGGYAQAGLRCVDRILKNMLTSDVPIIIHTILDEQDVAALLNEETSPIKKFPDHVRQTHKNDNGARLAAAARRILDG
jgi:CheY-like chemotaxis protein